MNVVRFFDEQFAWTQGHRLTVTYRHSDRSFQYINDDVREMTVNFRTVPGLVSKCRNDYLLIVSIANVYLVQSFRRVFGVCRGSEQQRHHCDHLQYHPHCFLLLSV